VRTHAIKVIIEKLLNEDWDPSEGREVPLVEPEVDCVVSVYRRCVFYIS
jgi:hypothetical protein